MVLKVSNALVTQDVEKAAENYKTLELATYPGHNISDFDTDSLRHIKIIQGEYALP